VTPEEAYEALVVALDLEDMAGGEDATWDDIVYYTRKAKDMHRLANRAVERRTRAVYDAMGEPTQVPWTAVLERLRQLRNSSTSST
jgi:hypothetical protein